MVNRMSAVLACKFLKLGINNSSIVERVKHGHIWHHAETWSDSQIMSLTHYWRLNQSKSPLYWIRAINSTPITGELSANYLNIALHCWQLSQAHYCGIFAAIRRIQYVECPLPWASLLSQKSSGLLKSNALTLLWSPHEKCFVPLVSKKGLSMRLRRMRV